jgi:hypothetical protein
VEHILELVHGDLCGPILPATPSGSLYFLLLIDDKSRFMWVTILVMKAQAAVVIKEFQSRVEAESGCKLHALRTDHEGEFTSKEFADYYAEDGVHQQLTAPYSPQQNNVVERCNAMVVGATRSMLKAKGLPRWVSGEAVVAVVYILNSVPCAAVEGGRTPFEGWYGRRLLIHHLRVFSYVVYVKNMKPNLKKLEDRGQKMSFIGYEWGSKAYRAYDPLSRRVTITRDMVFCESTQWSWTGGEDGSRELIGDNMFNVQDRVLQEEGGGGDLVMEPVMPPTTTRTPGGGYLTPSPGMSLGAAR